MVQQHGVRVLCEANGFSKDASDLLVAMIEPDPTRRVSAKGVLSSAWVQAGLGAPAAAALSQPVLADLPLPILADLPLPVLADKGLTALLHAEHDQMERIGSPELW